MKSKDQILLEKIYIKKILLKEEKNHNKPFYDVFLKYVKSDKTLSDSDLFEISKELLKRGLIDPNQISFFDDKGGFNLELWSDIQNNYLNLIQDFDDEYGFDLKNTDLIDYIMNLYHDFDKNPMDSIDNLKYDSTDDKIDNRSYREIEQSDRLDAASKMDPDQAAEFKRGA